MALVLARHQVFGVCEVGEQTVAAFPDDWTLVDPSTPLGHPEPVAAVADLADDVAQDEPAAVPDTAPAETA